MGKFSAITTVLFCFFTLSLALTPLNKPENDDVATAVSLPLLDANPSVPVNADDNPLSLPTVASTSVPLTTISLRPINRRFSKFPCHHHRHKFSKASRPLEIPYSNDMVVSSGENSDFQNPEILHEGSWQLVKHHHHEDSDSDDEDEDHRIKKMVLKRHHFGRFDAEKKLKKLNKHFRHENTEEEEHHKKKNSFMIRVRKFFYHHF